MQRKRVLSIVVTYNAADWLNTCLKSLQNSDLANDVLVVDNSSSDETLDLIQTHYPEVLLFPQKQNLGFGKANNAGFEYALKHEYEYIFLLNQDAAILPETLQQLVDCHQQNKDYGIISPMQNFAENQLDRYFASYLEKHLSTAELSEIKGDKNRQKDIYFIPYVNAAIWLISRECLLEVGGFDPDFEHYGEDDEYMQRVLFFKYKIGICPKAIGFHYRKQAESLKQELKGEALQKFVLRHALVLIKDRRLPFWRRSINAKLFVLKYVIKSFLKFRFGDGFKLGYLFFLR